MSTAKQIISREDVDALRNYVASLPPEIQRVSGALNLLLKVDGDGDLLQRSGEMQTKLIRDIITSEDVMALEMALSQIDRSTEPVAKAWAAQLHGLRNRLTAALA